MAYELDSRGDIRNQHLLGETVVISDKECGGVVDSTLTAGTLKLAQARYGPAILRSTLTGCEVIAEKHQKDYRLFQARFINCRFHGVFSGIDFGRSHTPERDGEFGRVEDCDFTKAILDGCRFFNVDATVLLFPTWPHVVLHQFSKRAQDVAEATWPGKLGQYLRICADQPESLTVSVIHVPSIAKLVGCSEDEIKVALEGFGGLLV